MTLNPTIVIPFPNYLTEVIQSSTNPKIWKITDFGISVVLSKYLLSTENRRGSPLFTAPEIVYGNPYSAAVDIWGLGLIFYQLFTGNNAFKADPSVQQWPCPHICRFRHPNTGLCPVKYPEEDFNPQRILTAPLDQFDQLARHYLAGFGQAVKNMTLTDERLLNVVDDWIMFRLGEVSKLMEAMLEYEPRNRPSIQVLEHHFRANCVRSMLEIDAVYLFSCKELMVELSKERYRYIDFSYIGCLSASVWRIPPTLAVPSRT